MDPVENPGIVNRAQPGIGKVGGDPPPRGEIGWRNVRPGRVLRAVLSAPPADRAARHRHNKPVPIPPCPMRSSSTYRPKRVIASGGNIESRVPREPAVNLSAR